MAARERVKSLLRRLYNRHKIFIYNILQEISRCRKSLKKTPKFHRISMIFQLIFSPGSARFSMLNSLSVRLAKKVLPGAAKSGQFRSTPLARQIPFLRLRPARPWPGTPGKPISTSPRLPQW
jgi:hypothetical protein